MRTPYGMVFCLLLWVVPLIGGCGGGGGEGGGGSPDPADLDPGVPPVTGGTWYRPPADATWQYQLQGAVNTAYDVTLYDVDLFDVPDAAIQDLQTRGIRVYAYFSAGSAEEWRPDYADYASSDLGEPLEGWPGERWVDVRSASVWAVILGRLDRAAARGFDGVEPDNVDGYANDTGFPLSYADQLAFNRNLANAAHGRGLSVLLKNAPEMAADLVSYYDGALTEQCHEYDECAAFQPFVQASKPVLNVEYPGGAAGIPALAAQVCPSSATLGLSTVFLPLDLDDAYRGTCP